MALGRDRLFRHLPTPYAPRSRTATLGVKWDTAWLIKQKLMEAMRPRNSIYKLDGDVPIDDAYLGGEKPGKTGRGAGNKDPFVIAVATRDGKPTFMQLRRVAGFYQGSHQAVRQGQHRRPVMGV